MKITNLRADPFETILATIAKNRGYNPARVSIVAQQFEDAAMRMNQAEVNISRALPSDATPEELQAIVQEIARETAAQVLERCARELARAAIELSYPKQL